MSNDIGKKGVAIGTAALLTVGSYYFINGRPSDLHSLAAFVGDCTSINRMYIEEQNTASRLKAEANGKDTDASRDHAMSAAYRQKEYDVCMGVYPSKLSATPGATPSATASSATPSSPSASPSSAKPSATATRTSATREFLVNTPEADKTGWSSFGPMRGLTKDKLLNDMSVDESKAELVHRMSIDPMLTAATGASLKLWKYADVDAKTALFLRDNAAWIKAQADIKRTLDNAPAEVATLNGYYTASYAIPGTDAPSVSTGMGVWRDGQKAIRIHLTDGTVVELQLQCGFQEYWKQQSKEQPVTVTSVPRAPQAVQRIPKPLPKPAPGMSRDDEGTPVRLIWVCNPSNKLPKQVRESERSQWPPVDSPKCEKTPDKPKPTPTPDKPKPTPTPDKPKPTPTPNKPKPTPTPDKPKPTPTPEPKDPSKDPNANGNAGNGGGKNQDPGPGAVTVPTHAPNTPRVNPPAPKQTPEPKAQQPSSAQEPATEPTKAQPAPEPEKSAPVADKPATGCAPAPGETTC